MCWVCDIWMHKDSVKITSSCTLLFITKVVPLPTKFGRAALQRLDRFNKHSRSGLKAKVTRSNAWRDDARADSNRIRKTKKTKHNQDKLRCYCSNYFKQRQSPLVLLWRKGIEQATKHTNMSKSTKTTLRKSRVEIIHSFRVRVRRQGPLRQLHH